MKLLTTILFASFFSLSVFACPNRDAQGRISDHEVRQYVEELHYLSSAQKTNEIIEKCYQKNKSSLNWSQVKILLNGLKSYSDYGSHTYDDDETQNRITEDYLSLKIRSINPELAVQISDKQSSSKSNNRLLEDYFNANIDSLEWEQVLTILNGLKSYSDYGSYTYDDDETQNRITKRYIQRFKYRISVERAVEMARLQSSSQETNRIIEEYFLHHKYELTWNQVQILLRGLKSYSDYGSHTYDDDETQNRIIEEWTACQ